MASLATKLGARHVGMFVRPLTSLDDEHERISPMLLRLKNLDGWEYTFEMLVPAVKDGDARIKLHMDGSTKFLVMERDEAATYLRECSAILNHCRKHLQAQERELDKTIRSCNDLSRTI